MPQVKIFDVSDQLLFMLLGLSVYSMTTLPLSGALSKFMFIFQISLFIFFVMLQIERIGNVAKIHIKVNLFYLLCILLLIFFLYSTYVNRNFVNYIVVGKTLTYPIIILLFFFYFPSRLYRNPQLFEIFVNYILYLALVISIVSICMLLLGLNKKGAYSFSSVGFFAHPNGIAFIYTFSIPIIMYKFITKKISPYLSVIILVILTAGLLFTFSRSGYLAVLISVLYFTFKRSKWIFILTIILIVIIGSSFFIGFAASKADSSYSRLLLAAAAYDMIFNSGPIKMLWGYGLLNNIKVFTENKLLFGSYEEVVDPHNFFLLLCIQFGILVAISVACIILYIIIKMIFSKNIFLEYENRQRLNLSMALFLSVIVQNFLEDIVVYPEYFVMALFFVFTGFMKLSLSRLDELKKKY